MQRVHIGYLITIKFICDTEFKTLVSHWLSSYVDWYYANVNCCSGMLSSVCYSPFLSLYGLISLPNAATSSSIFQRSSSFQVSQKYLDGCTEKRLDGWKDWRMGERTWQQPRLVHVSPVNGLCYLLNETVLLAIASKKE